MGVCVCVCVCEYRAERRNGRLLNIFYDFVSRINMLLVKSVCVNMNMMHFEGIFFLILLARVIVYLSVFVCVGVRVSDGLTCKIRFLNKLTIIIRGRE